MRIGLVPFRCKNKDIQFNLGQIERAMKKSEGKVDLLCFGEAFLQGFDSLSWNFEVDKNVAFELESDSIIQLREWTKKYRMGLLTGYIEKDQDKLYSSYVVLDEGAIVHNYRRISKGWKEFSKADTHYCEGTAVSEFQLQDSKIMIAICGDLWEYPEKFKTKHLLIWPVYVNYTIAEWEKSEIMEYARQAALVANDVLMINSIDFEPRNFGGAFHFQNGMLLDRTAFDTEQILIIDID